jgi:N-acetylneuraminic acid mutarotase
MLGQSATLQLTLTNNGGAALDFAVREREGAGSLFPVPGAPLREIHGYFSPLRFRGETKSLSKDGPMSAPAATAPDQPRRPIPPPLVAPWTPIANYPVPIMDNTAAEFEGKIYSVGGFDGNSLVSSGYVYDPAGDFWSPIANMSQAREKPAAAFIQGKLYVVGGWGTTGTPVNTLEIYDPDTDSWSTGAPVPTAFAAAAGVELNGQFYVIGGCDATTCGFRKVYRYDPASDTWTSRASYPEQISWQACGAIDGMIYCAGGSTSSAAIKTVYCYNPSTNRWSARAKLPQTLWGMGYTVADNMLHVSGGVTGGTDVFATLTNIGFSYDPLVNSWSPLANSNNVLVRGGSACAFYKVGGNEGFFDPVRNSEVHPGLGGCTGAVDVPWLAENIVSGALNPGENRVIDVTLEPAAPDITQAGDYFAQLRINSNTPGGALVVPITLHVTAPPTGTFTGTVRKKKSNGQLVVVPGATVEALQGTTVVASTVTDALGLYSLDVPAGTYTLQARKGGKMQSKAGQTIAVGETKTVSFRIK